MLSRKINTASNENPQKGNEMNNWKTKLKQAWNENPLLVISVGASVVYATAKIIDATSAAQGRRAYAKQVNYRVKHNQK